MIDSDSQSQSRWTYVEVEVVDDGRRLRPTHLCSTEVRFNEPPRLTSNHISITVRNGDRETTREARVLAHHADALLIPIELIVAADTSSASSLLTA